METKNLTTYEKPLPKVTFENMPGTIEELFALVYMVYQILMKNVVVEKDADTLFDIQQFCEYLPEKPARQTVYGWVNDRLVPYEKHGKRLFFRKSLIDDWLQNGRKRAA